MRFPTCVIQSETAIAYLGKLISSINSTQSQKWDLELLIHIVTLSAYVRIYLKGKGNKTENKMHIDIKRKREKVTAGLISTSLLTHPD